MAYDYALTHRLRFLKKTRAGSFPNLNYVQNRSLSYNHFDEPKSGSWEKNKNSYRLPEINKGESPKYPPYCKKKDTLFQNVLKRNNESLSQGSIACNALKDFLMLIKEIWKDFTRSKNI
jgi:hypothetical protein